tara:strand:- start:75 stop:1439 length:1365 start_codon:yes stop_codon:yes gene_type:complete
MRIKKYDFDYSRRTFMGKAAIGAAAGVLAPLWSTIAKSGEITKAYPEELLHIEAYTKGAIKPGDIVTADNVEHVKDLLDPIAYNQVKTMGRRIHIVETTTDVTKLFPHEYLEASLANNGKAKFDAKGNVVTSDGKPWIGGNPFPNAQTGAEAFANLTLSWGRHDQSVYAVRDWDISPEGDLSYQYDFVWAEQNAVALLKDGPYWAGHEDKLRFQSVWFTAPNDTKGTSFLNIWPYDQTQFPELYGYLPAFKRVRNFPTNQRFEPLVPGITIFLSDAWAAGDPFLTWGNYKIIDRKPMLGAVSGNFLNDPNWSRPVHGGQKGQTFFDTYMELIPETIVIEAEPIMYPRAPVSKKRVAIDTRNMMFVSYMTFDRRGEVWKSFEPAFSQYAGPAGTVNDGAHPAWSWTHVHSHDVQTNRISRFIQAKEVTGGYKSAWNMGSVYDEYMTIQAIRRLGD